MGKKNNWNNIYRPCRPVNQDKDNNVLLWKKKHTSRLNYITLNWIKFVKYRKYRKSCLTWLIQTAYVRPRGKQYWLFNIRNWKLSWGSHYPHPRKDKTWVNKVSYMICPKRLDNGKHRLRFIPIFSYYIKTLLCSEPA